MGLFSRRRHDPTDPDLTFMTVEEADHLRDLVLTTLAEHGIEATITDGTVEAADGAGFGLWNIATVCGAAEREAWPELVTEHVTGLLTVSEPRTPADMTAEDLLAAVRVRLAEEAYVRGMPTRPAGIEPFAPGIVRHLVVETETSVTALPAEAVTDHPGSADLQAAAERNTRALFDRSELTSQTLGEGDTTVRAVFAESGFTATFALFLPDVVRRVDTEADLSRGVVFAVPTAQQIVYHLPRDAAVVPGVVRTLRRFAGTAFDEGAGPVSPEIYSWQDGKVDVLTVEGEDGRVTLDPTGGLRTMLDEKPD